MAYASKYYDPVAAHEYYENYTKKGLLKGRQKGSNNDSDDGSMSTSGFSEKQKAAYKQVKAKIAETQKSELEGVSKSLQSQIESVSKGSKNKIKQLGNESRGHTLNEIANLRSKTSNLNADAKEEVVARNKQVSDQISQMYNQMESHMKQLSGLSYAEKRKRVSSYTAAIERIRVKAGLANTKTLEDTSKKVETVSQKSLEKRTAIQDKYSQKQTNERKNAQNKKTSLRNAATGRKQTLRDRYKKELYNEYRKIKASGKDLAN